MFHLWSRSRSAQSHTNVQEKRNVSATVIFAVFSSPCCNFYFDSDFYLDLYYDSCSFWYDCLCSFQSLYLYLILSLGLWALWKEREACSCNSDVLRQVRTAASRSQSSQMRWCDVSQAPGPRCLRYTGYVSTDLSTTTFQYGSKPEWTRGR